jgi:hypothetical protein
MQTFGSVINFFSLMQQQQQPLTPPPCQHIYRPHPNEYFISPAPTYQSERKRYGTIQSHLQDQFPHKIRHPSCVEKIFSKVLEQNGEVPDRFFAQCSQIHIAEGPSPFIMASPSNSSRRSAPHPSRSGGGASRPLYAIDFTAVACGKRIANTKRRVRWRFGFANPDALAAGETGTACRGEEHDVTMVWSVTSGKRLILADGQEVHYSNSRSAVIDFSWTMRGNHVLKVIAHATAPMSADPGFRQYDFFVDGRSFFTFPKVYRLGLSGTRTVSPRAESQRSTMAETSGRRKSNSIAAVETPHNRDEEDAYLAEAIKASLEDQTYGKKSDEKPKVSAEAADLLIDFMDDWNATG